MNSTATTPPASVTSAAKVASVTNGGALVLEDCGALLDAGADGGRSPCVMPHGAIRDAERHSRRSAPAV